MLVGNDRFRDGGDVIGEQTMFERMVAVVVVIVLVVMLGMRHGVTPVERKKEERAKTSETVTL
jgi:uncharacterized membrane protein